MRPGLALAALGIALVSSGCSRRAAPPPTRVPADPTSLQALLEARGKEAAGVRRYRGFVRLRGRGPEGGFSGRMVVIFERPERLRIELLGAFGSTRWVAVSGPDGIRVVFPGPGQFVEEKDSGEVVGRLLGVALTPDDVMALLSGVGTVLDARVHDAYREGGTRVAVLEGGTLVSLDDDGGVELVRTPDYRASYPTDWRRRGRQIPDRIVLETDRLEATLFAEAVDVNVGLDAESFDVEIPEDAERLRPAEIEGEAVFVVSPSRPPR